ncbi:hypothetical protein Tco_1362835 [Tanacetum coccineum]
MKCSKGSKISFEEKWPPVWQKWPVPRFRIKETLDRCGPEGKRKPEIEVDQESLTDEPIILEGMIKGHQVKKVQGFADRFLGQDIPPLGCDRPTDNHGGSKKEQNSAHGI